MSGTFENITIKNDDTAGILDKLNTIIGEIKKELRAEQKARGLGLLSIMGFGGIIDPECCVILENGYIWKLGLLLWLVDETRVRV